MSAQPSIVDEIGGIVRAHGLLGGTPPDERQRGPDLRVRCIADGHVDTRPSCNLSPDKDAFCCFGCGASGGILDLAVAAGRAKNRADAARLYESLLGRSPQPYRRVERAEPSIAEQLASAENRYRERHNIRESEILVAGDFDAIRAAVSERSGKTLAPVKRRAADSFAGGHERDPLYTTLLDHEWDTAWIEVDGWPACCNVDNFRAHGAMGFEMLERAERAAAAALRAIARAQSDGGAAFERLATAV